MSNAVECSCGCYFHVFCCASGQPQLVNYIGSMHVALPRVVEKDPASQRLHVDDSLAPAGHTAMGAQQVHDTSSNHTDTASCHKALTRAPVLVCRPLSRFLTAR